MQGKTTTYSLILYSFIQIEHSFLPFVKVSPPKYFIFLKSFNNFPIALLLHFLNKHFEKKIQNRSGKYKSIDKNSKHNATIIHAEKKYPIVSNMTVTCLISNC